MIASKLRARKIKGPSWEGWRRTDSWFYMKDDTKNKSKVTHEMVRLVENGTAGGGVSLVGE